MPEKGATFGTLKLRGLSAWVDVAIFGASTIAVQGFSLQTTFRLGTTSTHRLKITHQLRLGVKATINKRHAKGSLILPSTG